MEQKNLISLIESLPNETIWFVIGALSVVFVMRTAMKLQNSAIKSTAATVKSNEAIVKSNEATVKRNEERQNKQINKMELKIEHLETNIEELQRQNIRFREEMAELKAKVSAYDELRAEIETMKQRPKEPVN